MPEINFNGERFECQAGDNLRQVLLKKGLSPYNGAARWLNCKGLGTCGTCALEVSGEVIPKTKIEKWRLNFPPHHEENGLRLACQSQVLGDLEVKKHAGFWGEKVNRR